MIDGEIDKFYCELKITLKVFQFERSNFFFVKKMGNDQSTTKKTSSISNHLKCTHNLYPKYIWSPAQICRLIDQGVVSPMYPPSEECGNNQVFCEICYSFYPVVNKTGCCGHQICSECLAAVVPAPPKPRTCPFCKVTDFKIIPYITINNGGKADVDDDPEFLQYDQRRKNGEEDRPILDHPMASPEATRLANELNANVMVIQDFLNAGVSEDEIRSQFCLM